MRTVADIEASYDAQAGTYIAALSQPEYADLKKRCGEKLASIIEQYEPVNLLDAGTGEATTLVATLLAMKKPPRRVLGFDVSLKRLDLARKHMRDNELYALFIQASLDAIPLADESFDVVTTFHAVEPNRGRERKILKELLRVTRKALVMVEPSYELAHESARARMDSLGYVRGLVRVVSEFGFEARCEAWELDANPENPAALIVVEKYVYNNEMNHIPTFSSVNWYEYDRGPLAEVRCDRERDRANIGLAGGRVIIDGKQFECIAVEIMPKGGPVMQGELIGLLVRECSPTA